MPDYTAEIAQIDATLNSGVKSIEVDGTKSNIDTAALERRRRWLVANNTGAGDVGSTRPVVSRIRLDHE
jgi:hypothetical protein